MKKKNAGFTLIELLVVVLIIGILAAVALPQYEKAVEKSRVAEANLILKSLMDAYNRYYLADPEGANRSAPELWENLDISFNLPEADGGLARQGKYFWYSLETAGEEIWACRGKEQEDDWDYCLYHRYTENPGGAFIRVCEGRNEHGRKMCASVCGRAVDASGNCTY